MWPIERNLAAIADVLLAAAVVLGGGAFSVVTAERTASISVVDGRGDEIAHVTIELHGRSEYVSRDEVVLPKSRVYVREDDEYTVVVRARDARNRWTDRGLPRVRSRGAQGVGA